MVKAFSYAIALTGGIATGKSTVASLLKEKNYKVIDADSIAHKILDKQYLAISRLFGEEFIQEENGKKSVNRKALGSIIFGNSKNKTLLENLLHPLIFEEIKRLSEKEEAKGKIYFIDIPLFFESSRYKIKKSLLVYTSKEEQIQRLMARNNFSLKEAQIRIDAQMPLEKKLSKSSYIIYNTATLRDLEKEINMILIEIEKDFR